MTGRIIFIALALTSLGLLVLWASLLSSPDPLVRMLGIFTFMVNLWTFVYSSIKAVKS
jgi:hypothetical protein